MTYRKVRVAQGLIGQDGTTKLLVTPSSAAVYLAGTSTLATLYSNTTGTALANPVPTAVTPGSSAVGLTTDGNLIVYVDVPGDYEILAAGVRIPLSTPPVHNHDYTDHVDGTTADPHGDRAWASANFIPLGGSASTGWVWSE